MKKRYIVNLTASERETLTQLVKRERVSGLKRMRASIAKLGGDDSERADELRHEARSLLVILRTWRNDTPTTEDRAMTISRVLDLHRAVSEHASGLPAPQR